MKWTVQSYVLREVVQEVACRDRVLVELVGRTNCPGCSASGRQTLRPGGGVRLDALGAIMESVTVIVPVGLCVSGVDAWRMYHEGDGGPQACGFGPGRCWHRCSAVRGTCVG